jgi:hypothetical protein
MAAMRNQNPEKSGKPTTARWQNQHNAKRTFFRVAISISPWTTILLILSVAANSMESGPRLGGAPVL